MLGLRLLQIKLYEVTFVQVFLGLDSQVSGSSISEGRIIFSIVVG